MFDLFDEPEILLTKKQNYTGSKKTSALIIETKQGNPNSTTKEPKRTMSYFDQCLILIFNL